MLTDKNGQPLTPERLKRIRRRLGIFSAKETEEACHADRSNAINFLYHGDCSYCGLPRTLHAKRTKR